MVRRRLPIPTRTQMAGIKISVQRSGILFDATENFGNYDPNKQAITIATGPTRETQEETYLHELIEAANVLAEIGLEHRQIETLSALLHQALTTSL